MCQWKKLCTLKLLTWCMWRRDNRWHAEEPLVTLAEMVRLLVVDNFCWHRCGGRDAEVVSVGSGGTRNDRATRQTAMSYTTGHLFPSQHLTNLDWNADVDHILSFLRQWVCVWAPQVEELGLRWLFEDEEVIATAVWHEGAHLSDVTVAWERKIHVDRELASIEAATIRLCIVANSTTWSMTTATKTCDEDQLRESPHQWQ